MLVKDIMSTQVITVKPETPVKEIAQLLVDNDIKGVPVVDDSSGVIGVITECDLILQNAKLHIPTFIQILDGVFPLGQKETEEELRRIVGATADDVMSHPAIVIAPDATVDDLASLMWERKVNPVPVVEDGKLVGIVSRADIVRLLAST
ncbi:MAG TPA: CBS domain-containing protein [bacterium]|nr:CBS domain-containing protein [bacterium]